MSGTTDEKIRQIEDYLLRQVNDLNHNLENTTAEKIWQQTAEALTSTTAESAENKTEEQLRRDEYNSLRALVIKSATAVLKTEDAFSKTLQGAYLAQSDYGTFMENGLVNINGSPYTVAQLYKYQSTILNGVNKYKTELEGYITTGVLDRDTENPVFGMDIGYHKNKFTFNGVEYSNSAPSKIRITPNKISFCEGPYEVAYIEKKAVYFPVAHITGGSLAIGDNFSVDTKGNLTATSGSIAGFCIAGEQTAENGFWNWSLSSVVKTSSTTVNASNPEYAIFMRGQSPDGTGGAYKNNNVVFGVKERTSSETTWNAAEYNFLVRANGNLMANNAEITGTVNARNGYIGGFTVTGATSGTFWPASLASVIEPTDDSGYEYAVFLRGHYNFKGENMVL
ncbi:MAG: hypothetical protein IJ491_09775 [Clostridia bacterium]|nr:hypothetical protein [Clostridia bacterium]